MLIFPMKRLLGQIESDKVKYLYADFSHEEAFGADRIGQNEAFICQNPSKIGIISV